MRRSEDIAEALAFVDGCLKPKAGADFERRLAADPELKRQIEVWRKQNIAIRKGFATRRTTGDTPVAARAAANANRAVDAKTASNVTRFPNREATLASLPVPGAGVSGCAKLVGAVALGALILTASATWRPSRTEAFRDEAVRAWQAYRGADLKPPTDGRIEASLSLSAVMTSAWAVPADPAPARFALNAADGRRFGVLVGEGDGVAAFAPVAEVQAGTASAVWSDGRRLLGVVSEGSADDALAEARRLSRP